MTNKDQISVVLKLSSQNPNHNYLIVIWRAGGSEHIYLIKLIEHSIQLKVAIISYPRENQKK